MHPLASSQRLRPHLHPLNTAHCPEFPGSSCTAEPWLQMENKRNPTRTGFWGCCYPKAPAGFKAVARKAKLNYRDQDSNQESDTAESAGWGWGTRWGLREVTVGAQSCLATWVQKATRTALTS